MGGKSFVVDEDGNEEELNDMNGPLQKQDSHLTFLSTESGFNEDNDSENDQGKEAEGSSCHFQLRMRWPRLALVQIYDYNYHIQGSEIQHS